MQDKILDYLKKRHDYVSGDYLSQRLGISRQALWKHIQEIKDAGYDIIAVPHIGYKLVSSPDRLFSPEVSRQLDTKFIGRKIHYFDSVSSTMDIALQLGMEGAGEGTLVLSETQSRGRGRMRRNWVSPKYKGIYLSLILRPDINPNQTPLLTLVSAVSVCEAIVEETGLIPQIKWPNDILIHHKKIGGILTELNAEVDLSHFVVVGIGLNVNNDKKTLISGATSLKEQKKEPVSRVELLQEILRRQEANYLLFREKGSEPIIEKWREYNITLGNRVRVLYHKSHIEGEAVDLDSDGALLLRNDSGLLQRVTSGDITHCR